MKRAVLFLFVLSLVPLKGQSQEGDSPELLASRIWSALQSVKWETPYEGAPQESPPVCRDVPVHPAFRGGLYDYVILCSESSEGLIVESFYYPVKRTAPVVLLDRSDFRLANSSPETEATVEELLQQRLTGSYGAGVVPDHLFEIGASRPNPGLSWQAGDITVFLRRNQNYILPVGARQVTKLIAVRREVLGQRELERKLQEAFRSSTALALPVVEADLKKDLGDLYPAAFAMQWGSEAERVPAERETRTALLRLLDRTDAADRDWRSAVLVAADHMALRLGTLLVVRTSTNGGVEDSEAPNADSVRNQLLPYGIHYGGIGHYSGDLEYDRSLLCRAWNELPDTNWGQRAFLILQTQSCDESVRFGSEGPNRFRDIIRLGENFLRDYPQTQFRKEQVYHLALAYETEWSLSKAQPDDPTAEGAQVDSESASAARTKAIDLYEELVRTAPGSPEAQWGQLRFPRLNLGLDTGERRFFCFSD